DAAGISTEDEREAFNGEGATVYSWLCREVDSSHSKGYLKKAKWRKPPHVVVPDRGLPERELRKQLSAVRVQPLVLPSAGLSKTFYEKVYAEPDYEDLAVQFERWVLGAVYAGGAEAAVDFIGALNEEVFEPAQYVWEQMPEDPVDLLLAGIRWQRDVLVRWFGLPAQVSGGVRAQDLEEWQRRGFVVTSEGDIPYERPENVAAYALWVHRAMKRPVGERHALRMALLAGVVDGPDSVSVVEAMAAFDLVAGLGEHFPEFQEAVDLHHWLEACFRYSAASAGDAERLPLVEFYCRFTGRTLPQDENKIAIRPWDAAAFRRMWEDRGILEPAVHALADRALPHAVRLVDWAGDEDYSQHVLRLIAQDDHFLSLAGRYQDADNAERQRIAREMTVAARQIRDDLERSREAGERDWEDLMLRSALARLAPVARD
ncbi:hypothetical protein AB0D38_47645, partial [Streptomyces sp. NPDC048279]|uniref:hypothetical protein n=1 Tax=Streptomyces sp. NPDC048279 TaxID=3154714 RepID=UPI0034145EAD